MSTAMVQITRYPNRRFYARDKSNYVSLEDIEELVPQGKRVEIRDSQSDEDLTGLVLTRIIMDRQPDKMQLFPVDMLHFILRSNEVMSDFLRDYFRNALPFLEYLQRHTTNTAMKLTRPMHWIKAWIDNAASQPATKTTKEGKSAELSAMLEQRIADLEERIRQLESTSVEGTS